MSYPCIELLKLTPGLKQSDQIPCKNTLESGGLFLQNFVGFISILGFKDTDIGGFKLLQFKKVSSTVFSTDM